MIHLAGLQVGDPDALASQGLEKQRRADKRQALQQLEQHWKSTERKIAYLLKDADQIKMVEPALVRALAQVESEIEFLANETRV